jgi:DNA polymerase elongation subunit (family B)
MARKPKAPPPIIAVMDFETDPFEYGLKIAPFVAGLYYDTDEVKGMYRFFWGSDCVTQLFDYLRDLKRPMIIYAHNGGKFDFRFFINELENPIRVIHGRIVKAKAGIHEFRDSFSIIPIALKNANKKTDIDYSKMKAKVRDKHRAEILDYLYDDCKYLHELVTAFNERFGNRLTVAGTAAKELRKLHPQVVGTESHDKVFRPFYYGGRVQCFETGVINGRFRIYDVNSMYPAAMRGFDHPKGRQYIRPALLKLDHNGDLLKFPGRFYFAKLRCDNAGALPMRTIGQFGGLNFNCKHGEFYTTSHELKTALQLRLVSGVEILEAYVPRETQRFTEYVDKFGAEKREAKEKGEKIPETFAKLMLNSAYGRFGINPLEFYDYWIVKPGGDRPPKDKGFVPYEMSDECDYEIWRHRVNEPLPENRELKDGEPAAVRGFEDVAIAASITSAARSILLRAIHSAKRPIYCDTDSLICEELRGVPIHESEMGAWKFEGQGDRLAIAGKKLYAVFNGAECIKLASKGVRLTPEEVVRVASGEMVDYEKPSPAFDFMGGQKFVHRRIQSDDRRRLKQI